MSDEVKKRLLRLREITTGEEREAIDREIELRYGGYCDDTVKELTDAQLRGIIRRIRRKRKKKKEVEVVA